MSTTAARAGPAPGARDERLPAGARSRPHPGGRRATPGRERPPTGGRSRFGAGGVGRPRPLPSVRGRGRTRQPVPGRFAPALCPRSGRACRMSRPSRERGDRARLCRAHCPGRLFRPQGRTRGRRPATTPAASATLSTQDALDVGTPAEKMTITLRPGVDRMAVRTDCRLGSRPDGAAGFFTAAGRRRRLGERPLGDGHALRVAGRARGVDGAGGLALGRRVGIRARACDGDLSDDLPEGGPHSARSVVSVVCMSRGMGTRRMPTRSSRPSQSTGSRPRGCVERKLSGVRAVAEHGIRRRRRSIIACPEHSSRRFRVSSAATWPTIARQPLRASGTGPRRRGTARVGVEPRRQAC